MKLKSVFSIVIIVFILGGITFGIRYLKEKMANPYAEKGLVVIGKAPHFSFTNQHGKTISNHHFKGKIYVVDFFFTSCPSICPLMTTNMVKVQNAFDNNAIAMASFSINPEEDTPQVLRQYAQLHGITNPNWHLLTGNPDAILKLSNEGFNIYAEKNNAQMGGFEHSGLFALIDQNGNIVCRKNAHGSPIVYYNGLEEKGIQMLIEDIKKLQK